MNDIPCPCGDYDEEIETLKGIIARFVALGKARIDLHPNSRRLIIEAPPGVAFWMIGETEAALLVEHGVPVSSRRRTA